MQRYQFIKEKGKPLYIQLYQYLKNQILDGYLQNHEKLLSVRMCASQYQLSQTSVLKAYEKLLEEGLVQTKHKSGYFVCMNDTQRSLRKTIQSQQIQSSHSLIKVDLRSHSVSSSNFDKELWNKCIKEVLDLKAVEQYGDAQGEQPLRIALQKHAYEMRNVLCDIEQMIIGASVQSLLYIFLGLLSKDDVIAMEEDAFPQAQFVFQQFGFQVLLLKRKTQGIDLETLYTNKVKILYLNVNSCGTTYQELNHQEKQALIKWAKDCDAYIIEDDHNGELNYRHESCACMQGNLIERICYIGSFSRILLPSIRISYMILPKEYYQIYQKHHHEYGPTSSKIEQLALSEYIIQGHMKRHIKRLKKLYYHKSLQLEQYLRFYFSDAKIQLKESSLAYLITLPRHVHIDLLKKEALNYNIVVEGTNHSFMIGFASIETNQMEKVILFLAKLYEKYKK